MDLEDHHPIPLDTPSYFGGEGIHPCPDELFFSSIGGCLLTTFLYFQRRLELPLKDVQISVRGEVKFLGPKGYTIDETYANIKIKTTSDAASKAERCAKLTEVFC